MLGAYPIWCVRIFDVWDLDATDESNPKETSEVYIRFGEDEAGICCELLIYDTEKEEFLIYPLVRSTSRRFLLANFYSGYNSGLIGDYPSTCEIPLPDIKLQLYHWLHLEILRERRTYNTKAFCRSTQVVANGLYKGEHLS